MNVLKWVIWFIVVAVATCLTLWTVSEGFAGAAWLCVIEPYAVAFSFWVTINTDLDVRKRREG